MINHTLTELIYSDDINGTLRLYVYNDSGTRYIVRQYFSRQIQYSDEETTVEVAHHLVIMALLAGREIRITNGSDYLVFHAVDGKILYPENPEAFWEECAK